MPPLPIYSPPSRVPTPVGTTELSSARFWMVQQRGMSGKRGMRRVDLVRPRPCQRTHSYGYRTATSCNVPPRATGPACPQSSADLRFSAEAMACIDELIFITCGPGDSPVRSGLLASGTARSLVSLQAFRTDRLRRNVASRLARPARVAWCSAVVCNA